MQTFLVIPAIQSPHTHQKCVICEQFYCITGICRLKYKQVMPWTCELSFLLAGCKLSGEDEICTSHPVHWWTFLCGSELKHRWICWLPRARTSSYPDNCGVQRTPQPSSPCPPCVHPCPCTPQPSCQMCALWGLMAVLCHSLSLPALPHHLAVKLLFVPMGWPTFAGTDTLQQDSCVR